jgi:tRNA G18 (ribose-2'-O)-methylase SpoU
VAWVPIDDPRDPRIAHFVGLRDRELARRVGLGEPGVFIAEGDIVAERAARAGYEPRAVLVDATRTVPLPPGVDAGVPVYAAAAAVLQRITGLGVHRGLLACFDRRPPRPATEVVAAARRVVVLERVSNPTNLGVLLRSAAGLGMDAVLLDPTCSDPLYRRTSRVAMGEGYAFPWAWIPRLPGGRDVLRAHGFRLVALTPTTAPFPSTSWRSTVPASGAPTGEASTGWRCCSEQKGRGCRPGPWRPPRCWPASPCGAGSIR